MCSAGQATTRNSPGYADCLGRRSAFHQQLDHTEEVPIPYRQSRALREAFETLQKAGIQGLYYIPGDHLYGDDTEGATDASHANDLGFMRQADIFEPILKQALGTH